jgi:ribosomal protein L12E/L44/L45/RPP1/RPP2
MKPMISQSFDGHPLLKCTSVTEENDTDEMPARQVVHTTDSTCASPNLWRREWSGCSSFVSATGLREALNEDKLMRLKNRRSAFPSSEEDEIGRIRQESEETRDFLRFLARDLGARVDDARASSVSTSLEARVMKEYMGRLSCRLDHLMSDTLETEKELISYINSTRSSSPLETCGSADRLPCMSRPQLYETPGETGIEARLQKVEATVSNLQRVARTECILEAQEPETASCACAVFKC